MKKLTTLIIAITALLLGTITISAAPGLKKGKKKGTKIYKSGKKISNGWHKGYYNRRGVYIYTKVKYVKKRRGLYKNTYQHKIFPNGRHKVKLLDSYLVKPNRHYNHGRTRYVQKVVHQGWKKYLITYKITRLYNGRVIRKVVKKKRLYGYAY